MNVVGRNKMSYALCWSEMVCEKLMYVGNVFCVIVSILFESWMLIMRMNFHIFG